MEYKASHPIVNRTGALSVDAKAAGLTSSERVSVVDGPMDVDEELRIKGH